MIDATTTAPPPAPYPVRLTMEYPERLSRLATFFRLLLVIPVIIFVALVGGGSFNFDWVNNRGPESVGGGGAGAVGGGIVAAIWVTILLRGNIPRWLFDFQVGLNRFTWRAYAYGTLLTDKYPAFEGDWALNYDVEYPERLSRWKVFFWKLITLIPHFIVLMFLFLATVVVVIIAWFAILFTGAFPRGLHRFVVGVLRWGARVGAYFESLTDAFPPFSLDDDAPAGSDGAQAASAVAGGVLLAGAIAGGTVAAIFLFLYFTDEKSRSVPYDDVLAGSVSGGVASVQMDRVRFTLEDGADPADVDIVLPAAGARLVSFTVSYENLRSGRAGRDESKIDSNALRLDTSEGSEDPVLLTFDGVVTPLDVARGDEGELIAVFEVDAGAYIEELQAYPNSGNERHISWQFE